MNTIIAEINRYRNVPLIEDKQLAEDAAKLLIKIALANNLGLAPKNALVATGNFEVGELVRNWKSDLMLDPKMTRIGTCMCTESITEKLWWCVLIKG